MARALAFLASRYSHPTSCRNPLPSRSLPRNATDLREALAELRGRLYALEREHDGARKESACARETLAIAIAEVRRAELRAASHVFANALHAFHQIAVTANHEHVVATGELGNPVPPRGLRRPACDQFRRGGNPRNLRQASCFRVPKGSRAPALRAGAPRLRGSRPIRRALQRADGVHYRYIQNTYCLVVHLPSDDRSRIRDHVLPEIGKLDVRTFTRDYVEDLRDSLDVKIVEGALAWKTASCVWTLVTSMCSDIVTAKKRELRTRDDNPCRDVKPPESGILGAKQYLLPVRVPDVRHVRDRAAPMAPGRCGRDLHIHARRGAPCPPVGRRRCRP